MSEPLYGIIGTGMMGCEHILNLGPIPDAQVTAIADASNCANSGSDDSLCFVLTHI